MAFEGVVAVGVLVAEEGEEAGGEVGGEEEGAPAFVLADVDVLVVAREVEAGLVLGEDDVAEGHGGGAVGEGDAAAEEEGGEAAVQFEDAAGKLGLAAGEADEGKEDQAEEGVGGGPEVAEDAVHDRSRAEGVDKLPPGWRGGDAEGRVKRQGRGRGWGGVSRARERRETRARANNRFSTGAVP